MKTNEKSASTPTSNSTANPTPTAKSNNPQTPQALRAKTRQSSDVRTFVLKHWRAISISIAFIIVAAFSIGAIKTYLNKKNQDQSNLIYEFKNNAIAEFKTNKINKDEFLKKWNDLNKSVGKNEQIFFAATEVLDYLISKKDFTAAQEIAAPLLDRFRANTFIQYFLSQYLAAIYEDMGDSNKAIEVLEQLIKSNVKILEAKIYFDLGRLYLQVGKKDKAKANLGYIEEKFPSTSYVKIAKLYLKQL
ncbi:MAG: hypothetical protein HQK51_07240 [Oligoflexia bacterium]|nr:hypothetical protein [Oligoflexia bacterium]